MKFGPITVRVRTPKELPYPTMGDDDGGKSHDRYNLREIDRRSKGALKRVSVGGLRDIAVMKLQQSDGDVRETRETQGHCRSSVSAGGMRGHVAHGHHGPQHEHQ
jgi:hypothetical protein